MSGSPPSEQVNGISPVASATTCTTISCIYPSALERYSYSFSISMCELLGISFPVFMQFMSPQHFPDFHGAECGFGCRLFFSEVGELLVHVDQEHAVLKEAIRSKDTEKIWRHVPLVFKCAFCSISNLFRPILLELHLMTFHRVQLEKGCQTDLDVMHVGQKREELIGVPGSAGEEPPTKKIRI